MIRRIAIVSSFGLALLLVGACSSSSSSTPAAQCNTDPSQCTTGTTCWPIDTVPNFGCIASKAGASAGTACQNTPNVATCGDDEFCLETTTAGGTCEPYCNPSGASTCPGGESCQTAVLEGGGTSAPKVSVCAPTNTSGFDDGGTQSDTGTKEDAADGA